MDVVVRWEAREREELFSETAARLGLVPRSPGGLQCRCDIKDVI